MIMMGLRDLMVLPEVSPYRLPTWGEDKFRQLLAEYFDFEELRALSCWPDAPALMIGAVEVLSGHFELFSGDMLRAECLLASAAIPELFGPTTSPDRGVFWYASFPESPDPPSRRSSDRRAMGHPDQSEQLCRDDRGRPGRPAGRARPPDVVQRGQRSTYGPAGEEDVVDQHHGPAVHTTRRDRPSAAVRAPAGCAGRRGRS